MTTLIYRNGELYGDRRFGVRGLDRETVFINKPKIWQHPNRQLALGVCGDHKGKNIYPALGDALISYAIKIERGEDVDWNPIWDKFFGGGTTLMLITKRDAWVITKSDDVDDADKHGFVRMDLDEFPWYIVGSGQHAGGILLAVGDRDHGDDLDMGKVYKIVAKVDGMTSAEYGTIRQRDLLVFKGVKK